MFLNQFRFHVSRLAALHGETDISIERSSFSRAKADKQVREEIVNKNIDEFNIFLSASIVKINNKD